MVKKPRRKSGHFVMVPHLLIETLSPAELQVWCAVQLHNPDKFTVSAHTIAKDIGKARSYIHSILHKLLDKGLLSVGVAPNCQSTYVYRAVQCDVSELAALRCKTKAKKTVEIVK